MPTHRLYPIPTATPEAGGYRAEIESASAIPLNANCGRCALSRPLSGKVHHVCMAADGKPGGLLVVAQGPARLEDDIGRPLVGQFGKLCREVVGRAWRGPVVYDNAVRCPPGDGMLPIYVERCRPYLAGTIRDGRFKRIVALGRWAAYSILGRTVDPFSVRRGFGWLAGPPPVPVFFVTVAAMRNRFVRDWFEADLTWALTVSEPPFAPPRGVAHFVSSGEEAVAAAVALRRAPWVSLDCEWSGALYSQEFTLLDVSLTPGGTDDAYVWDYAVLRDRSAREPLAALLRDPRVRKTGSGLKEDHHAVNRSGLGPLRGIDFDVRLARKLMDTEADGDLETMAELVGMGGHKREALARKEQEFARFKRAVSVRAVGSGQVSLISPPALLPEYPSEVEEGIVAQYARGEEKDRYAYALIPADVRARYNGRDTVVTDRLRRLLEPQLLAEAHLSQTWLRVIMPLSEALQRVEENGIGASRESMDVLHLYLQGRLDAIRARLDCYRPAGWQGKGYWADSPKAKQEVLFRTLKLPPVRETKTGFSTDGDTLEALQGQHEVVGDLIEYASVETLDKNYGRGLVRFVRGDGRIHPSFLQDGTRGARPSCTNPNLLNLKRPGGDEEDDDGRMVRNCFVAPPGNLLISLDYSQGEPREAADESGDPVLIGIFDDPSADLHMTCARLIAGVAWGIRPEECQKYPHRATAKTIFLGLFYGRGAAALCDEIRRDQMRRGEKPTFTIAKAEQIKEALLGRFVGLKKDVAAKVAYARVHGCTWTSWDGKPSRRRNLWQIGDQDGNAAHTAEIGAYNCLDEETEALTTRGWVKGFSLSRDDVLLTKSMVGVLEWQPLTDLKLWPDYEGPLVEFRSKTLSAVSTPNHRWMVTDRRDGRVKCVETSALDLNGFQGIHRAGCLPERMSGFTDDFVEACGWFLTDGTYSGPVDRKRDLERKRRKDWTGVGTVTLCQSERGNPEKVARIFALLERLGWGSSTWLNRETGVRMWKLRRAESALLHGLFPDRVLTTDFLARLGGGTARRLLEVMLLGDGHTRPGGQQTFCARKKEAIDAFQVLAILAGQASTIVERDMSGYRPRSAKMANVPMAGRLWYASLLRRQVTQVTRSQVRRFNARQGIWCPVVPNTFFVARREGKVFVTGNTVYQSRLADKTNQSLVEIDREIVEGGLPAKIVLTVYDQIILEAKGEAAAREVAAYAHYVMVTQPMARCRSQVDVEWGEAWGSLEELKL